MSVAILNEINKSENNQKRKVFYGANIFRLYYVYFLIIYIKGYMFLVSCKLECKEMFDPLFSVAGLGGRGGGLRWGMYKQVCSFKNHIALFAQLVSA